MLSKRCQWQRTSPIRQGCSHSPLPWWSVFLLQMWFIWCECPCTICWMRSCSGFRPAMMSPLPFKSSLWSRSIQRVHRYQKSSVSLGLNLRPAPASPKLPLRQLHWLGPIPSPLTSTPSCCPAPEDLGFSHLAGGEKLLDPLVFLLCLSLPSFVSGIQITT